MAVVQTMLLLDMVFEWRWALHDLWVQEAMRASVYGERREPQLLVLMVLMLALCGAAIWVLRKMHGQKGAAVASVSTLVSVGLWCCESISYHDLDRIFYRMVGGVMLISLMWLGLALIVVQGALLALREGHPH